MINISPLKASPKTSSKASHKTSPFETSDPLLDQTASSLGFSQGFSRKRLDHIASEYISLQKAGFIKSRYVHQNIIEEIGPETDNGFSHSSPQLLFSMNCYGFINHLLKTYFPDTYDCLFQFMIENQENIPVSYDGQPCPFHYAGFIRHMIKNPKKTYPLHPVEIDKIQPGDLVIYEPENYKPLPPGNYTISSKPTGTHVMVVNSIISQYERPSLSDPQHGKTKIIRLKIIDCTRRFHDPFYDSRSPHQKGNPGGIGTAHVLLTQKSDETFTRLRWRPGGPRLKKKIYCARIHTVQD